MLDTFLTQCSRKLSLCQEPWPGPEAEMLLSHSFLTKATVFRSLIVCCWAVCCSPLQNSTPSSIGPRERAELCRSVYGMLRRVHLRLKCSWAASALAESSYLQTRGRSLATG